MAGIDRLKWFVWRRGGQLFKSFLLLYIHGVLVGVLGIYSQLKLIILLEVRSYFLFSVPWLDGLWVCVASCQYSWFALIGFGSYIVRIETEL